MSDALGLVKGNLLPKWFATLVDGRNLQLPGDGRYQPEPLQPYLGYDNWASWLIIVEWYWLKTLAKVGVISTTDAKFLTDEYLQKILHDITTTYQDDREYGRDGSHDDKGTKHDILALLELLRESKHFPSELKPWLHFGLTSYDVINTAYALQWTATINFAFDPMLREIDSLWRQRILENAEVVQAGRTHLQTALPVTVGFWLAALHNRFINCSRQIFGASQQISGKLTGAVGTSAAIRALIGDVDVEQALMETLGLPRGEVSTQITVPEPMARLFFELTLLSGVLANLGEDVRILQSSQFGELTSASSSSSTMAHKRANPISAEQVAGMHTKVLGEFSVVMMNLVSDLQRDLRGSCVMRSYAAIMTYVFQQLKGVQRILKTLVVDVDHCRANFDVDGKLVMAELLHLSLQRAGFEGSHGLVNGPIITQAREGNYDLRETVERMIRQDDPDRKFALAWGNVPEEIKNLLQYPERYLGDAVTIATNEVKNELH